MSVKPIFETLKNIRSGELLDEAAEKFNDLIYAIQQTKKGGDLTIKLRVDPLKSDTDKVLIRGTATTKKPEPEVSADFFYTTDDSNVQTRNPRQQDLNLRDAAQEEGEIKDAESSIA